MRIPAALALALLAATCSMPRDEEVRAEFLRAHPGARLENARFADGIGAKLC